MVFLCDEASTAAVLNLEEALIAVGHAVGAANGIVIRRTDLLTAAEEETLHASFHRYNVHMFPAIVPLHLTLITIELVVGTANKLALPAADLVAKRSRATVLCRNLNHPLTACLASQMAKGPVNIAVASTNWFVERVAAVFGAVFGLLQGRALADVRQLDAL